MPKADRERTQALMYIPAAHRIEDRDTILQIMQSNPFATLISTQDGEPVATHLPVLVESGEPFLLLGHMAKANSHWRALEPDSRSLVIFSGPHGYVSPRWYESRPNVPTWNYVTVHAYGRVELEHDDAKVIEHLGKMVATFDPTLFEMQPESVSPDYFMRLRPGIVMFRLRVERLEAKAKLNQNKGEVDRLAVRTRYLDSEMLDERQMGKMMPPSR